MWYSGGSPGDESNDASFGSVDTSCSTDYIWVNENLKISWWYIKELYLKYKSKQDWVAFMSQPHWVEVMIAVELRLRLKWGWDEI